MTEKELIIYLKKHFIYNEDGTLNRTDRRNSNGSYDKDGYLIIKIKGKQYKAHRLIYAMHHNRLPNGEIDHINRVRNDNRIENLREVNRIINVRNSTIKPNKDTGVVGVHIDRTKGLKKKFTTKLGGKTFRFYSVDGAVRKREEYYEGKKEGALS